MKKFFLLGGGIIAIILAVMVLRQPAFTSSPLSSLPEPAATPTTVSTPKPQPSINLNGEHFNYSYFIVQKIDDVTLIPNFSQKKDSKTTIQEHNCAKAINGGFYDTAGKPLGFFVANSQILSKKIPSNLLNGFIWKNTTGEFGITTEPPDEDFIFALQTGPMLLINGNPLPLTIQNDEHARRMVAAKTEDAMVFIVIYTEDSVFSGPFLSDLPAIVESINSKEHLRISKAVNLDGGSASAFYGSNITLSELAPVGSLFCLR